MMDEEREGGASLRAEQCLSCEGGTGFWRALLRDGAKAVRS